MEILKEEIQRIILFSPVPKQEDLCCMLCQINPSFFEPKSLKTSLQWKILKCRMLIFSEKRVIASPFDGLGSQMYVIMSKDYYETGKIHDHFERIGINFGRSVQVTKSAYETCLRYSILARIAPLWNQMGSYLVKGRNFLQQKEPLLAVTLDVFITGKEMGIVVWPHRIRIYNISLEELVEEKKEKLSLLSEVEIDEGKWVHVLPSLKKARVVSVLKRIPAYCQFTSYKQLKRHWKNNYGYRLPEEEEDCPFYVTVSFGDTKPRLGPNGWSGPVYIYPAQCICHCPPVVLRCTDQAAALKTFLCDLSARVPHICDQPFAREQVELGYAVPKIHSSNERNEGYSVLRLDMKPFGETLKAFGSVPVESPRFLIQSAEPFMAEISVTTALKDLSQNSTNKEYPANSIKDDSKSLCKMVKYQTAKHQKIRYAPLFKSKFSKIVYKSASDQCEKRPVNRVCKILNNLKQNSHKSNQEKRGNQEKEITESKNQTAIDLNSLPQNRSLGSDHTTLFLGDVTDSITNSVSAMGSQDPLFGLQDATIDSKVQGTKESHESINLGTPSQFREQSDILKKTDSSGITLPAGSKSFAAKRKNAQSISNNPYEGDHVSLGKNQYFTMEFGFLDVEKWNNENLIEKDICAPCWKDGSSCSSVSFDNSKANQCFQLSTSIVGPSTTANSIPLRKVTNSEDSMKGIVKKKRMTPRSRPIVQTNIDVGALARGGMLSKANTATLITWLRARGVTCRVKDKKSDLVHLVEEYLGLPSVNPMNLSQSM